MVYVYTDLAKRARAFLEPLGYTLETNLGRAPYICRNKAGAIVLANLEDDDLERVINKDLFYDVLVKWQ